MAVQPLCRAELTTASVTLHTSTNARTQITAATLTNKTAGAVTATIYIVDSGGAISDANAPIIAGFSVAANSTVGLPELVAQALSAGQTLRALASANSALILWVSGDVVTG